MEAPAVKDEVFKVAEEAQSYIQLSTEYVRLKGFKLSLQFISILGKITMVFLLGLVGLFFLSLSAAWALGAWSGSLVYGFLIMGGIFAVLTFFGYLFRDQLEKPLLRTFSELYFKDHE